MIEGCCFVNAQLKSHQYNDHSVTAANSSRHTIVCATEISFIGQRKISVCGQLSRCKVAVDKADR